MREKEKKQMQKFPYYFTHKKSKHTYARRNRYMEKNTIWKRILYTGCGERERYVVCVRSFLVSLAFSLDFTSMNSGFFLLLSPFLHFAFFFSMYTRVYVMYKYIYSSNCFTALCICFHMQEDRLAHMHIEIGNIFYIFFDYFTFISFSTISSSTYTTPRHEYERV